MNISEQVEYLREFDCFGTVKQAMDEAADTIESLSAKLSTANKDLEKTILEKIREEIEEKKTIWGELEKPPYSEFEQELYLFGLRKARDIILSAANMERSKNYYSQKHDQR